jgi:anti-anti-sigma regulatory factor
MTPTDPRADHQRVRLEGRLAGPWVDELARVVSSTRRPAARVVLDMSDVTFADRNGVRLLQALRREGIELVECSPFILSLVNGGVP